MNFRQIWSKYWFFIGIAVVVTIAFIFPSAGLFIRNYNVLDVVIFLAFLITGLTLETSSLLAQMKNGKVLASAMVSSLILFPIIAYYPAAWIFGTPSDASIGMLILGIAPVTVASGTVMTAMALGNIPLSLFICVLCNFAAIFTIPFMLNLIMRFGETAIVLPVSDMLLGLLVKVLVPIVIGQLLRPGLKQKIPPFAKAFSIFNQSLVLMIIFNAVSSSTDRIVQAGTAIIGLFIFALLLHFLILALNYGISKAIKLDLAATSAFTIHTSQKTLTVAYLVWAGYFAAAFPMALIPSIAYHIIQMVADTFVAHKFKNKFVMSINGSP